MAKKVGRTVVKLATGRRLVKHSNGIWYLETFVNKTQKRRSLGTEDFKTAEKLQEGLETAKDELPAPAEAPAEEEPEAPTLSSCADEYLKWYERENRKSSLERTAPFVRSFIAALGAERDPRTLKREDIQKFIAARTKAVSAHTVRSDFQRLRAFLYWIADMKSAADKTICIGKRLALPKPKRGAKPSPSVDKVRAVIRALGGGWISDYFRVLIETGARPSEILGIRATDLRDTKDDKGQAAKSLRIAATEERDLKTEASERTILLSPVAAEILQRRKDVAFKDDAPLFPNVVGEVFKENSAYHVFRETLAGGKGKGKAVPPELDMTLYDARHFFCSEHAAPGPNHMAIEELGAYIGHSAASTQTLMKHYVDARALLRGAPSSVIEQKDGVVIEMKKSNG